MNRERLYRLLGLQLNRTEPSPGLIELGSVLARRARARTRAQNWSSARLGSLWRRLEAQFEARLGSARLGSVRTVEPSLIGLAAMGGGDGGRFSLGWAAAAGIFVGSLWDRAGLEEGRARESRWGRGGTGGWVVLGNRAGAGSRWRLGSAGVWIAVEAGSRRGLGRARESRWGWGLGRGGGSVALGSWSGSGGKRVGWWGEGVGWVNRARAEAGPNSEEFGLGSITKPSPKIWLELGSGSPVTELEPSPYRTDHEPPDKGSVRLQP